MQTECGFFVKLCGYFSKAEAPFSFDFSKGHLLGLPRNGGPLEEHAANPSLEGPQAPPLQPAHLRAEVPLEPAGYVFVALGWYLLAKVLEVGPVDHAVYDAARLVSGHTLKHLAAAAGAFWLLLMVKYHRPRPRVDQPRPAAHTGGQP
jgi:hypothetical protein